MFCVADFLKWLDKDDKNAGIEPIRETAVVPERWLTPRKSRCYWPLNFKENMLKMPVNLSWPDYEVEVRGTYGIYV